MNTVKVYITLLGNSQSIQNTIADIAEYHRSTLVHKLTKRNEEHRGGELYEGEGLENHEIYEAGEEASHCEGEMEVLK